MKEALVRKLVSAEVCCSKLHQLNVGNYLKPKKLSGVFRLGRTMILGSLRVKGSRFTAVASQLHTWSRNEDQQDALTWSVHLS